MTSVEFSLRPMRIARHSRVNSSMMSAQTRSVCREDAELPAIVNPALDEVIGPDMVGALWPKPDARSVIQPEPTSLRLLLRNLQPSRRQMRSTRLAFTVQPSDRSIAVILR
jgi:hypothetical protein